MTRTVRGTTLRIQSNFRAVLARNACARRAAERFYS
jgi:hypothetical protein